MTVQLMSIETTVISILRVAWLHWHGSRLAATGRANVKKGISKGGVIAGVSDRDWLVCVAGE